MSGTGGFWNNLLSGEGQGSFDSHSSTSDFSTGGGGGVNRGDTSPAEPIGTSVFDPHHRDDDSNPSGVRNEVGVVILSFNIFSLDKHPHCFLSW